MASCGIDDDFLINLLSSNSLYEFTFAIASCGIDDNFLISLGSTSAVALWDIGEDWLIDLRSPDRLFELLSVVAPYRNEEGCFLSL